MENKKITTRQFVRIALLTALAAVLTMFPHMPTPTGGYVHFGDSVIYIAAIFLGPVPGMIVGAFGHSIADAFTAPIFIPATFIVKGIMGLLIGKIAYQKFDIKHFVLAGIVALIIVVFGYFFAEWIMFGLGGALTVFVSSPIQWGMSLVASAVLIPIFRIVYKRIN